jgi:hypothetical protein
MMKMRTCLRDCRNAKERSLPQTSESLVDERSERVLTTKSSVGSKGEGPDTGFMSAASDGKGDAELTEQRQDRKGRVTRKDPTLMHIRQIPADINTLYIVAV